MALGDKVDHAIDIGPRHHHGGSAELAPRQGDETGGVRDGVDGKIGRRRGLILATFEVEFSAAGLPLVMCNPAPPPPLSQWT